MAAETGKKTAWLKPLLAAMLLAGNPGCGVNTDQGPNLGDRLTIQDGEPAVVMDSQHGSRTVSNPVYDANKRVIAFDFDFKSNDNSEHYTGKIFNIRRDDSGRVMSFEAIINGQHGTVTAQREPSLLPDPRADREAAAKAAAESARLEAEAKVAAKRAAMRNSTNQTLAPFPGTDGAATAQLPPEWADASRNAVKQGGLRVLVNGFQVQGDRLQILLRLENDSGQPIEFKGWSAAVAEHQPRLRDQTGTLLKRATSSPGTPIALGPGQATTERLQFEGTLDKIDYLRLELPADVFGGYGLLRLHLPRNFLISLDPELKRQAAAQREQDRLQELAKQEELKKAAAQREQDRLQELAKQTIDARSMYKELISLGARKFSAKYPAGFELRVAGVVRKANKGFFLEHDPAQVDRDDWRKGYRRIYCMRDTAFRTGQKVLVVGAVEVGEVNGVPRILLAGERILERKE